MRQKILLFLVVVFSALSGYSQTYGDGDIHLKIWVHKVWSTADCSEWVPGFNDGADPVFKNIQARIADGLGTFDITPAGLSIYAQDLGTHAWYNMDQCGGGGGFQKDNAATKGFLMWDETYSEDQVPTKFDWKISEAYEKDGDITGITCHNDWFRYQPTQLNPFGSGWCINGDDYRYVNTLSPEWQTTLIPFRGQAAGAIGYILSDAIDADGGGIFGGSRDDMYGIIFAYQWTWVTPLPPTCTNASYGGPRQDGPYTVDVRLRGIWSDSDYDWGVTCTGGFGDEELRLKYQTQYENGGSWTSWTGAVSAPNRSQNLPGEWIEYATPYPNIFTKSFDTDDTEFGQLRLDFETWEEDGCGADNTFDDDCFPSIIPFDVGEWPFTDDDAHNSFGSSPDQTIKWRDSPPNTWNSMHFPIKTGTTKYGNWLVWVDYNWSIGTPVGTIDPSGGYGSGTIYDRVLCIGNSTTIKANTDDATYFQWEWADVTGPVTAPDHCPPSANWSNAPGASNCPSYVPPTPHIAGTRIYRLKMINRTGPGSTSQSNLGRYTETYTNCVRVTYYPYGPPIESDVCDSKVFLAGEYNFSIPAANDLDGVVNQGSILWEVLSGSYVIDSPTAHSTDITFNSLGTHTVRVTVNHPCGNSISTCTVEVVESSCGFIYVSHSGSDANSGSAASPKASLTGALALASGTNNHIRMELGTFTESNMANMKANVVIEGGFLRSGSDWTKTSGNTTVSFGDYSAPTGGILGTTKETPATGVGHRLGIKAFGVNNWKIQDININTTNVALRKDSRGYSNYAVWVRNCSGFVFENCTVQSGAAYSGLSGTNGANGAGGSTNNGSGGAGRCDCNGTGQWGDAGGGSSGIGSGIRYGGAGGNGRAGAGECACAGSSGFNGTRGGNATYPGGSLGGGGAGGVSNFCNFQGRPAINGKTGGGGGNGAGGSNGGGQLSPSYGNYFTPSAKGANGTHGRGGGGAGGGGGGGGQGDAGFPNWNCYAGVGVDNGSGGGGGGGGGGGEGGALGTGSYGGGGAFGIYVVNSTGNYWASTFNGGTAGAAGVAGSGGTGGIGSNGKGGGGQVCNDCGTCWGVGCGSNEIGYGGSGGKGGDGGSGGTGQSGSAGVSNGVRIISGGFTNNNGSANPVIDAGAAYVQGCTNSAIKIDKNHVRYIRLEQTINEHINLRELQAFELGTGTNVAQNKSVNSSSNWHQQAGCGGTNDYGCLNLTDNSFSDGPDGLYHTGWSGSGEWVEIDLAGSYDLDYIRIHNRGNCCEWRAATLRLVLKNSAGQITYSQLIDASVGAYTDFDISGVYTWSSFPGGGEYVDNLSENETAYGSSIFHSEVFYTSTGDKDVVTSSGTLRDLIKIETNRTKPVIVSPAGGLTGRYVRIKQNINEAINLAELKVIQTGTGTNLALNKTVNYYSVHGSGSFPGSELVDNITATNQNMYHSAGASPSEWVEVDLGSSYELDKVQLWNRFDCCYNRARDFQLIVYDDDHCEVLNRPIDGYENVDASHLTEWNLPIALCNSATVVLESDITDPSNREEVKWEIERLNNGFSRTLPGPSALVIADAEDPGSVTIPSGGNGLTGGTDIFQIKLQVRDACCGWSIPVYQEIMVIPDITTNSIVAPTQADYCVSTADPPPIDGSTDAGLCFFWEVSVNGGPWTDASGTIDVEDYNPGSLPLVGGNATTYDYRRIGRRYGCEKESNDVRINVYPEINNNIMPDDIDICTGVDVGPIGMSAAGGGDGNYTYEWQRSFNGGAYSGFTPAITTVDYDPTVADLAAIGTHDLIRIVRSPNLPSGCDDVPTIALRVTTFAAITGNTLTDVTPVIYCGDDAALPATIAGGIPAGGNGSFTYAWAYEVNGSGWQAAPLPNTAQNYAAISLPLVNGNTTTYKFKRYVNSSGCSDEGPETSELIVRSPKQHIELFTNNKPGMIHECEQDNWVYYTDQNVSWDKFYFAIDKNTNNLGTTTVKLDIRPDVIWDVQQRVGTFFTTVDGSFLMRRYWNVNHTGTIDVNKPVKVKFYYSTVDSADAINKLVTEMAAYPGTTITGEFQWFKTTNQDFSHTLINNGNNWAHFGHYVFAHADLSYGFENGTRFIELSNITSFSGGTGGAAFGTNFPALPVSLVSFSATARTDDIITEWLTASEVNNEKFEVWRSTDAINFVPIGEVPGHGTTPDPHSYSLVDYDVEVNTLYYYKLKQIDFDGNFEFSNIVSAIIHRDNSLVIGDIVPNPTTDMSYIEIISPKDDKFTFMVIDMLGREYSSFDQPLMEGSQKVYIDANEFAAGTYLVNILSEYGVVATRKLQVLK